MSLDTVFVYQERKVNSCYIQELSFRTNSFTTLILFEKSSILSCFVGTVHRKVAVLLYWWYFSILPLIVTTPLLFLLLFVTSHVTCDTRDYFPYPFPSNGDLTVAVAIH